MVGKITVLNVYTYIIWFKKIVFILNFYVMNYYLQISHLLVAKYFRFGKLLGGKTPPWECAGWGKLPGGKTPTWEKAALGKCLLGKTPDVNMTWWNVPGGKCRGQNVLTPYDIYTYIYFQRKCRSRDPQLVLDDDRVHLLLSTLKSI